MKLKGSQHRGIPADPSQWSEASQRSVSAEWMREYNDIEYSCWRCSAPAVFSAEEQKYTFEIKKAPIDQRRILCPDCWKQSQALAREIQLCDERWAESKLQLSKDKEFLSKWLQLLTTREAYVPYRPHTAAKNMLANLLGKLAEQAVAVDRAKPRSG